MANKKKELIPAVIEPSSCLENYEITALSPQQQRFIHLYITGGYKLVQIAQLLGVASSTVSAWLANPVIREIINQYQADEHAAVTTALKSLTSKAVDKLSGLVDSPIDGVALAACKDILDRTGHKPQQQIKIDKTVTTFEKQLDNLINDIVIDADYEIKEDDE